MGAYSTIKITRNKAKLFIINKLQQEISYSDLEKIMDLFLENHLYNCQIVPDHCEENQNKVLDILNNF